MEGAGRVCRPHLSNYARVFTVKRTAPLTLHTVTSLEEFKGLAKDWDQLLRTVPGHSVFLTWEWLYYWAKHFLAENRLKLILFQGHDERLIGVAPLYLRMRVQSLITIRELRFLGSESVCS